MTYYTLPNIHYRKWNVKFGRQKMSDSEYEFSCAMELSSDIVSEELPETQCDYCNCAMRDCQYCSVNGYYEEVD